MCALIPIIYGTYKDSLLLLITKFDIPSLFYRVYTARRKIKFNQSENALCAIFATKGKLGEWQAPAYYQLTSCRRY